MAVPFVVLGYKAFDHLAENHWDKIPDRAFHIHDPKKKEQRRQQRKEERGEQVVDSERINSADSQSREGHNSDQEAHMYKSKHREYPTATFDDGYMDDVDRMQFPDARNPAYSNDREPRSQARTDYTYREKPSRHSSRKAKKNYVYSTTSRRRHASRSSSSEPNTASEDERTIRKTKVTRPAIRSRSSHQGDRYYPTATKTTTTVSRYDRGDRENRGSRDKRQQYEAQMADKFSGTDLGLGALALGSLTGGYVGYKAGESVNGKKRGGITPLVLGVLGALAGGTGLNAAEREREKQKQEKAVMGEQRSQDNRRSNKETKGHYKRTYTRRAHDGRSSGSDSGSEDSKDNYRERRKHDRRRSIHERGDKNDRSRRTRSRDETRKRKSLDLGRSRDRHSRRDQVNMSRQDDNFENFVRNERSNRYDPQEEHNEHPQFNNTQNTRSAQAPGTTSTTWTTEPPQVHPITARNLQENNEHHSSNNESSRVNEYISETRTPTKSVTHHVKREEIPRAEHRRARSSSLSSISSEDSWGEDERSKRERRREDIHELHEERTN